MSPDNEQASPGLTPAEESFLRGDETALTPDGKEPPKAEEKAEVKAPVSEELAETEGDEIEQTGPDGNKKKWVNKGALDEERNKRREREKELATEREARIRLEERMAMFSRPDQPQKPAPTVDTDPIAVLKETSETLAQLRAQQAQSQELSALSQALAEQEAQHVEKTPDYWDAKAYLRKNRYEDYVDAGLSPQEAMARTARDEAILVKQFLQQGVNPAEKFYTMAKRRGYAASLKHQIDASDEAVRAAEAKKLETAAKGQAGAKSLSGASGGSSESDEGVEALLKMSNEEFAKATEGKKWKKVMGG